MRGTTALAGLAIVAAIAVASAQAPPSPAPPPPTGAAIDAGLFRHIREVPAGEAGLVALPLDAAVLAESAGPAREFSDVRLIDPGGHEVPYLLDPLDGPLALDLTLERTTSAAAERTLGFGRPTGASRGTFTVYRVRLPYTSLPRARLVLTTDSRVFERAVVVGVEHAAGRQIREPWLEELGRRRWVHTDSASPTPPLVVPIRSIDVDTILIVVDEGDNSPLPIGPPRILLPSYRIRFYRAAAAPLRLAYGREDLSPPRYDLELLAPQVLTAPATEVTAGPDTPNPATGSAAAFASPWFFWTALGVAVVVLLAFVARLARKT